MSQAVTKLSAPRAAEILRRPRVLELLNDSLSGGVCWVAAPGGYGKTTAVVDYLRRNNTPHIWFRVDEGDRDIARFFYYLSQSFPTCKAGVAMPVFTEEYAEQPSQFARIFFQAYYAYLNSGLVVVFDDLHRADTADFRSVLAVMLREMPASLRCICLSRSLPDEEAGELLLTGAMGLIDRSDLEFTNAEARDLLRLRSKRSAKPVDLAPARGWALGLVLLAEQRPTIRPFDDGDATAGRDALFSILGQQIFESLTTKHQDILLKLNLLPELNIELANAMAGSSEAGKLLERLYQRQLLVTRAVSGTRQYQFHDLLRDFLENLLTRRFQPHEQASLRKRAAEVLREAGRPDDAIRLALRAEAWTIARELMLDRAETLLAEGRRATIIDWCERLPSEEMTAWLCYWRAVAHMPDDAATERWLSKAWERFRESADLRGQCLATARAVLVKTNSWRTYQDMSTWTHRARTIIQSGFPELSAKESFIVRTGMVRALDFADESLSTSPAAQTLVQQLLGMLATDTGPGLSALRLSASESLIEHAITMDEADLFAEAVDSVVADLSDPDLPPSILGSWLVVFGAASGRYFSYSRRGFPYATPEEALRVAIAIGERESFRNIEFGGLYHLQILMKMRSDFSEFSQLVRRISEIADSRFTTQVAVVADCYAAVHARQGDFVSAYRDCERFMAAIEAANEPIIERWPHYITKFQVLLADRKPSEACDLLTDLMPRLEGGLWVRTNLCILAATALQAKWRDDPHYADHLRAFLAELHAANWPSILVNMPEELAELLADALDHGIEADYCRTLIHERRLKPPARRPLNWPWALKLHVLGGFRLEQDGRPVKLGAKPPTRALDILRVLALSRDGGCSVETLQDWLWADLEGDKAKAAYEQALHRLRRLLGRPDLIIQREGNLQLASDLVWVDLLEWDNRLKAVSTGQADVPRAELEDLLHDFPGPLLHNERVARWQIPAIERVRNAFIDLAVRVGTQREQAGQTEHAQAVYQRALEFYPYSHRIYKNLISARLAQDDPLGAVASYRRYERTVRATSGGEPSPEIRSLIGPHLGQVRRDP